MVEILDEQIEQTKTKIDYIGEKPIPHEIRYISETDSGKMECNTSLGDKVVTEIGGHRRSCSECTFIIDESENIEATISWNDNLEELKLEYDN
ncbi:hypothetical protein [Lentibacillus sp. Marseille-P4043]|uniref:hypothetical protein n=1 Tax=Lentibacillus sp. Marseille-P4043 TaxID=2040293 RepID=UPI000D0AF59B|nr:hypothetical protein [Lentibacillus sp. Marseille-P4043]